MKVAIFKEGEYFTVRYKELPFFWEWWFDSSHKNIFEAEKRYFQIKERGTRDTKIYIKGDQ